MIVPMKPRLRRGFAAAFLGAAGFFGAAASGAAL
jgi:hypothetical protein